MHPGIDSWRKLVSFTYHFFCIPLFLRTLFRPLQNERSNKNADPFERIIFSLVFRLLGLIVRLILIVVGLVATLLVLCTFPIFFFVPIQLRRESLRDLGSLGSRLSYGNTFHLDDVADDVPPSRAPLFGKEKALRMMELALEKKTDRNILLVGDAGVGKTLLIAHVARLGRSGLSPSGVAYHRVVSFTPADISVEALDLALHEAASAGNIILAIENIHAYPAIFERLLPFLSQPNLGIIATTDFGSYDSVLKPHAEFLSKFKKIDLEPIAAEDTVHILQHHAATHKITISEDALQEIVRLSERYIGNQPQPLKSIIVLDELSALGRAITIEDVRQVVSDKTNMPIGDIGAEEQGALIALEDTMKEKIIGQDEAVREVAQAMKRLRAGVSDPNKPASFLFLGPTGVGKTYTAKILAENYFGSREAMVRFDMSEFALPDSAPAFSERLGAIIEERPFSLVFLDELEKAHRIIHQLLLQVLDEGRLTRENGREVNFKNTIIIVTSNAGSRSILDTPDIPKKTLVNTLIAEGTFAPEFLNRWTEIVLFKALSADTARHITELLLRELGDRLYTEKGYTLEITDTLIDTIANAGFDPEFGARPIRRAIEELVENKIADYLVQGGEEKVIRVM